MSMKNQFLLTLTMSAIFLLKGHASLAQTSLERYIAEGLSSNIILQQKHISLEKATYDLKIAKSLFIPSVNFNTSYTSGQGGRAISFPVGDMMNPVYHTLNLLTESNMFPQIENVEQTFFPFHFVDARIRTSMPVYNTDLFYNKRIQEQKVLLQDFELQVYKRELIKTIKISYYNYLSAVEAVKIYESALQVVERNQEVNESLYRNGKVLPAAVLRAKSELENVKAQLGEAKNHASNAKRYFNFLLNRDLESPVETSDTPQTDLLKVSELLDDPDYNNREELKLAKTGEFLNHTILKMNQAFWQPRLSAFLDLGAQAENAAFSSKSRYYLVGISMDIPLFNGFRNSYKIRQSSLDVQSARLSFRNLEKQLQLSGNIARSNLKAAFETYKASEYRLDAAQSYFNLLEKGYKEGANSLIEFIDARNQLTATQLQVNINRNNLLIAIAQLERELAID